MVRAVIVAIDVTVDCTGDAVLSTVKVVIDGRDSEAVDKTVIVGTGAVTVIGPLDWDSWWVIAETRAAIAASLASAAEELAEAEELVAALLSPLDVVIWDGVAVTVIVTSCCVVWTMVVMAAAGSFFH